MMTADTPIDLLDHLVASPACHPEFSRDEAFQAYASLGFRRFEVFTGWVKSAFMVGEGGAAEYRAAARGHGLALTSFHLPVLAPESEASWRLVERALDDAVALGCGTVLYKASTLSDYCAGASRVLDMAEGRGLTVVIQNHKGSALTTVENVRTVIDGVGDRRLRVLLEVGHFEAAGIPWREAYAAFRSLVRLVHIKDIKEGASVRYGEGTVDLPGLFRQLRKDGYRGDIVVELELRNPPRNLEPLSHAIEYLGKHCRKH